MIALIQKTNMNLFINTFFAYQKVQEVYFSFAATPFPFPLILGKKFINFGSGSAPNTPLLYFSIISAVPLTPCCAVKSAFSTKPTTDNFGASILQSYSTHPNTLLIPKPAHAPLYLDHIWKAKLFCHQNQPFFALHFL